ncbi:PE-PPE domain-containing protein [[Mycobacterium] vasticus]|uniref:PE-PPE domain-containing protein n=1 Tax=[Mycobacterium] vasticus TaxID=2875777 RepID=A0ABU5Z605_9MYCO|nr:PE-PPE domain-containing protein [Mycolicibacter sp. MYC017]MEB3072059.1 PE-PPE domain-containing protein [Mycolicibacter sp. MYC017]
MLTTPQLLQQGQSTLKGASDLVSAVQNELQANPGAYDAEHPLTIFGYSQGAAVASIAMTELAKDGVPLGDLHFVLLGDPGLPGGAWPNVEAAFIDWLGPGLANFVFELLDLKPILGLLTPTDLYPTTIYTLEGDGVAEFQKDWESGGGGFNGLMSVLNGFTNQHGEYLGLTSSEIANSTVTTDGNLTLVQISDDLDNQAAHQAQSLVTADGGQFDALLGSLLFAFTHIVL